MKLPYFFALFLFACCTTVSAQEWEQVASLPPLFDKTHHSFAFALDGKGYIVTGESPAGPRNDFFQYDPDTDEWSQLPGFPGAARGFAIGDIWDGKAYMGFGRDISSNLKDLWVFDPADMSWTQLASCPCVRRTHPAMVAHNGKVFVGLGGGSTGNLNDWWEYDIATDTWSQKPDFPALPRHHPFQFGVGDYIYTGFGHGDGFISDRWYRYEPNTEVWEEMTSIPSEGRVAGTQFAYGGKGYVLSGDGGDHLSMEEGEFWEYDPVMDTWTQLPSHPGTSRWAPASFVLNGEVYIINGDTFMGVGQREWQTEIYKYTLDENVSTDEPVATERLFKAFPNPASNLVNFEWDASLDLNNAEINIYDMQGRQVLQTKNVTDPLDISGLASGLLRVELVTGKERYYEVVMKR